ncbi:MAG: hypothetical protein RI885_2287 [Actinomycetota bacterium]|jgi:hypothetical protein
MVFFALADTLTPATARPETVYVAQTAPPVNPQAGQSSDKMNPDVMIGILIAAVFVGMVFYRR